MTGVQGNNYVQFLRGLKILQVALVPFVRRELMARLEARWWTEGILALLPEARRRELPPVGFAAAIDELDVDELLLVLTTHWNRVFQPKMRPEDQQSLQDLIAVRQQWSSHPEHDMPAKDAWRALDTMTSLIEVVAPGQAAETRTLAQSLREQMFAMLPAESDAREEGVTGAETLPGWRDHALPLPEIRTGQYEQTGFTVDLAAVAAGTAPADYVDPQRFWATTYITESMASVLEAATERIGRKGSDGVISLKAPSGGGKSHGLLAVYHLLTGNGPTSASLPRTRVAMMACAEIDPTRPRLDARGQSIVVRTLWGELAALLGGREAYEMMRRSDEQGAAPTPKAVADMLDLFSPCAIILDDLAVFARNIYGLSGLAAGTFETLMTFMQTLVEAARRTKRCLVVCSVPAATTDIGGEAGMAATDRLRAVLEANASAWHPVRPEENLQIVRRRLFVPAPAESDGAAAEVCAAYWDMYRQSSAFPAAARDEAYLKRMVLGYPIHPELVERLALDWVQLDRFQGTRGILRFLAAALYASWKMGSRAPLLQPGTVPLGLRSRAEFFRYLPERWNAVLDADVTGEESEARRLDVELGSPSRPGLAERLAATIFVGSAAGSDRGRRGISEGRLLLGAQLPGDDPALVADVMQKLEQRLVHLYVDDERFRFDPLTSLRPLAREKGAGFDRADIHREIEKRLREDLRERGEFAGVYVCPDLAHSDIPDDDSVRLVVLPPSLAHRREDAEIDSAGAESPALEAARQSLEQAAGEDRVFRNTLVFLAADTGYLGTVEEQVRTFLGWKVVWNERDTLNLDVDERRQAEEARNAADAALNEAIQKAYSWLLVPFQESPGQWWWEPALLPVSGESCVLRASARMVERSQLLTQLMPGALRRTLDTWLWPDRPHVATGEVWQAFCRHGYLPRLRDKSVLLGAIVEGAQETDYFGFASSIDESGRYVAIVYGDVAEAMSIRIDGNTLLVKPEAIAEQLPSPEVEEAPRAEPDLAPIPDLTAVDPLEVARAHLYPEEEEVAAHDATVAGEQLSPVLSEAESAAYEDLPEVEAAAALPADFPARVEPVAEAPATLPEGAVWSTEILGRDATRSAPIVGSLPAGDEAMPPAAPPGEPMGAPVAEIAATDASPAELIEPPVPAPPEFRLEEPPAPEVLAASLAPVADVSSAEAPEADPGAIAGPVDLEEPAFNGQSDAPTAPNLSDEDTPLGWGRTVAPPGGARREELIAPASTPKSIVVDLSEPELEPASSAEDTATASPDGAVELAPAEETEPATMEAETMSAPAAPPAGFPQPEESAHSLEQEEPVESSEPAEAIAYAEAVDVDSPPELPDSAGSGRPRRRFRGIVELDPERVGEDAGLVADDVVAVLRLLADDKVSVQLVLESSLSPEADDSDLEALFSRCRRQRFQVAEVEDE